MDKSPPVHPWHSYMLKISSRPCHQRWLIANSCLCLIITYIQIKALTSDRKKIDIIRWKLAIQKISGRNQPSMFLPPFFPPFRTDLTTSLRPLWMKRKLVKKNGGNTKASSESSQLQVTQCQGNNWNSHKRPKPNLKKLYDCPWSCNGLFDPIQLLLF